MRGSVESRARTGQENRSETKQQHSAMLYVQSMLTTLQKLILPLMCSVILFVILVRHITLFLCPSSLMASCLTEIRNKRLIKLLLHRHHGCCHVCILTTKFNFHHSVWKNVTNEFVFSPGSRKTDDGSLCVRSSGVLLSLVDIYAAVIPLKVKSKLDI